MADQKKFGIVETTHQRLKSNLNNLEDGKMYVTIDSNNQGIYIKAGNNDASLIGCAFNADENRSGLLTSDGYNIINNTIITQNTDDVVDDVSINTYIKYVAQSLTDIEKSQARNNIGATTLDEAATLWEVI